MCRDTLTHMLPRVDIRHMYAGTLTHSPTSTQHTSTGRSHSSHNTQALSDSHQAIWILTLLLMQARSSTSLLPTLPSEVQVPEGGPSQPQGVGPQWQLATQQLERGGVGQGHPGTWEFSGETTVDPPMGGRDR